MCAWQYVYGNQPVGEAQVGAAAVRDGADCLVIDAESEYEGKYVSAQTYIDAAPADRPATSRSRWRAFPYVDFHPAFPYSVFLGPGGAQYNAPQMYWRDIGVSVDTVYAHTYAFNRLYGRPIFPLGRSTTRRPPVRSTASALSRAAIRRPTSSWWDWQEASGRVPCDLHPTSAPCPASSPIRQLATIPLRPRATSWCGPRST